MGNERKRKREDKSEIRRRENVIIEKKKGI